MVDRILRLLIYLAVLVGLFVVVFWVFGMLGIHLPPQLVNVIIVILVLLGLLCVWRLFAGRMDNFTLFPPDPPNPSR